MILKVNNSQRSTAFSFIMGVELMVVGVELFHEEVVELIHGDLIHLM